MSRLASRPGFLGSSQQRGSGSPPMPPGAMGRENSLFLSVEPPRQPWAELRSSVEGAHDKNATPGSTASHAPLGGVVQSHCPH